MFWPQPDLKVGEGTIPIKYLNDEGKEKTRDMKNLYFLVFDSPKYTQKQKKYPEEMSKDNDIR